tara:strand:+ start:510 stop:1028 length:519 start_codon:yes stop_codon:yes gene_type:complete
MDQLIQDLEELRAHNHNHVEGMYLQPPTSASTANYWRINRTEGAVVVKNTQGSFDAETDYSIYSDGGTPAVGVGQSRMAAIVLYTGGGYPIRTAVLGSAATSGNEVAPTAAEITSALGSGYTWIRIGETTLINTLGSISQNYDNAKRPILGVNVTPKFGDYSWVPAVTKKYL